MSELRSQVLFAGALIYAVGVSYYVGVSTSAVMQKQPEQTPFFAMLGGAAFLEILGIAIGFMLLVALLDVITQRKQQMLTALTIGLAAAATYQAAVQLAFIQSYAHYKALSAQDEPTAGENR